MTDGNFDGETGKPPWGIRSGRIYIKLTKEGKQPSLWGVKGDAFLRIDGVQEFGDENSFVIKEPSESFDEAVLRKFGGDLGTNGRWQIKETKLNAGQYYPRIARPNNSHPLDVPGIPPIEKLGIADEIAATRDQIVMLMQNLVAICQTVHPQDLNMDAYGLQIRNLILLACTEVEALWRAVLNANGFRKKNFSTRDYVKLAEPLRLDSYVISFPYYPWLDPVRPFSNWANSSSPTKELDWYDDYQAIKHDRTANFSKAKLRHAFSSVAACVVVLVAQVGKVEAFRWRSEFGYFFRIVEFPKFDASEVYVKKFPHFDWEPVNYQF